MITKKIDSTLFVTSGPILISVIRSKFVIFFFAKGEFVAEEISKEKIRKFYPIIQNS